MNVMNHVRLSASPQMCKNKNFNDCFCFVFICLINLFISQELFICRVMIISSEYVSNERLINKWEYWVITQPCTVRAHVSGDAGTFHCISCL